MIWQSYYEVVLPVLLYGDPVLLLLHINIDFTTCQLNRMVMKNAIHVACIK